MTQIHHTTSRPPARRRPVGAATQQSRIRLISEGVVASYIHDISARPAASAGASSPRPDTSSFR